MSGGLLSSRLGPQAKDGQSTNGVLGIDIGGSGIKGAIVDPVTGAKISKRHRIPTPQPAVPDAVEQTLVELTKYFSWTGPIGCTFPGVVQGGYIRTAANLHPDLIGLSAVERFSTATGCPTVVLNDGDAAGVAEMRFGAGRDVGGVVIMATFGTGIGTAVFVDGVLVPNTELGHIEIDGVDAETKAAARIKDDDELSWGEWGARVDRYLSTVEDLLWPDLFIIGGGVSKRFDQFRDHVNPRTPCVPAELRNEAGIIGAALIAESMV